MADRPGLQYQKALGLTQSRMALWSRGLSGCNGEARGVRGYEAGTCSVSVCYLE